MSTVCRDCFAQETAAVARCRRCRSPRLITHVELDSLCIAHLDCDAFYASVEKRDRPVLRDKAVIIGGGRRGVVTTACYIARLSGVRSAMPMFQARRLCPEAEVISPNFVKYRAESRRIFEKVRELTPQVQPLALDEAWMDLSGTQRLHGASPAVVLVRLQAEIERDIGLPVSIGLAPNKFLAKIASDLDKPRGFAVIGAGEARTFLSDQSVRILPGVGPVQAIRLETAGFAKVRHIADADPLQLVRVLGDQAHLLWRMAGGEDHRPVDPSQVRKSISAETTFMQDLRDVRDLEDRLLPLCERVARIARQLGVAGRVITLKLRASDFQIITRRQAQTQAVQTARTLFGVGRELLAANGVGNPYRLIGIGISDLELLAGRGGELFQSPETRTLMAETAMDGLRTRFGEDIVVRARGLKPVLVKKPALRGVKPPQM